MALPSAVRKQAEAADKMIAQLGQASAATAEPENVIAPVATEIPAPVVAESPAAQQEVPPTSDPEGFKPLTQPLGDEDAKWAQRYQTLQGKYNAEVPRLQKRVSELEQQLQHSTGNTGELQQLRDEVARLKQQQAHAPAAATPPQSIQQLQAEYGADFVDSIREMVRAEMAPVMQRVDDVGKTTQQNTHQSRVQALSSLLAESGINLDQWNVDPLFNDWLDEVDSMSGIVRKQLLNQAIAQGNIQRAANFFTAYEGQQTTGSSAKAPDLNKHVSVPSSAAQIDQTKAPSLWTPQRQEEFWAEKNRASRGLPTKNTPEQLAKLEQELFAFLRAQPNA